jgi:DNA-binding winged helix-turn-helix (wHTH) protein/Tol biopolymer transport system component
MAGDFRLSSWLVQPSLNVVSQNGSSRHLEPKVMAVLLCLVKAQNAVVSKQQLIEEVWKDTFVTDDVLTRCISELRKAFEDDPKEPRVIETIPRRGYRLLEKVERDLPVTPVPPTERNWKWVAGSALIIVAAVLAVVHWWPEPRQGPESHVMLPDVRQTQLTKNSSENPLGSAAISPDGRYLAYADLAGIHIKVVETGDVQNIAQPASLKNIQVDWTVGPWFNDGARFLAVANFPSPQSPNFSPSTWTVSLLGGVPHLLRENGTAWSISPNGSTIAFTTTADRLHGATSNLISGDREIWLMDQDGKHPRQLYKGSERDGFAHVQWLSDGQRVAYLNGREAPEKDENSIESLDLKGSQPVTIMPATDPSELQEFCWLPDGRIIYLKNDNYWGAQTGAAGGESRPLTNWAGFGMGNMSVTADGKRLAFLKSSVREIVYVADHDASRTQISVPRQLSLADAQEIPTGWTADSKAVLFISNRNGRWELFKQLLGEETAERLASGIWENEEDTPFSPDGRWYLYLDSPSNRGSSTPAKLMRVPAAGGPPEEILTARVDGVRCAGNLCAILEPGKDPKESIFTAVDPVKGRDRELVRFKDVREQVWYDWALSPDGTRIALLAVGEKTIHVLSLNGQPEQLIDAKEWSNLEGLSWDVDGKGLISSSSTQRSKVLLYIDLHGHARVLWQQGGRVGTRLRGLPSPDGRHLAISAIALDSNAWMMENF